MDSWILPQAITPIDASSTRAHWFVRPVHARAVKPIAPSPWVFGWNRRILPARLVYESRNGTLKKLAMIDADLRAQIKRTKSRWPSGITCRPTSKPAIASPRKSLMIEYRIWWKTALRDVSMTLILSSPHARHAGRRKFWPIYICRQPPAKENPALCAARRLCAATRQQLNPLAQLATSHE